MSAKLQLRLSSYPPFTYIIKEQKKKKSQSQLLLAFLAKRQLPHRIWMVNGLNTLTLETKMSSLFKYLVGFLSADTKL